MKKVRLIPVVFLVVVALLGLKLGGLVFAEGPGSPGQALAEEKPKVDHVETGSVEKAEEKKELSTPEHMPGKVSSTRPKEFISSRQDSMPSRSEIEVLQSLRDRRKDLDRREEGLRLRENLLKAAEKRLEKRVMELKEIESKIEKAHQDNEEKSKKGMKSLVSMYSNMKPKDAARIFDTLDMEVLIGLVDQMNARKMAPVLAKMRPAVAKALTVEIAERLNRKNKKAKEADPLPSIPEK